MLHPGGEGRGFQFSCLHHKGTIVVLVGKSGSFQDLFITEVVPVGLTVGFADAAIVTVLPADVGKLHQSPEMHLVSYFCQLHLKGPAEEFLLFVSFRLQ